MSVFYVLYHWNKEKGTRSFVFKISTWFIKISLAQQIQVWNIVWQRQLINDFTYSLILPNPFAVTWGHVTSSGQWNHMSFPEQNTSLPVKGFMELSLSITWMGKTMCSRWFRYKVVGPLSAKIPERPNPRHYPALALPQIFFMSKRRILLS